LHAEWIEYLKRENKSRNFDQFKDYYMPRKLQRFIQIDRPKIEEKKDEFILVQTEVEYNEKCHQNPEKKNIHYLIANQDNQSTFLWQKSSGPVSTLDEYLIKQDEEGESIEEGEIFHKNNEQVLIISAQPGMGKSLILDHFTQNSSVESFFIKIVLNTCTRALSDLRRQKTKFKNSDDSIEFVLKSLFEQNGRTRNYPIETIGKRREINFDVRRFGRGQRLQRTNHSLNPCIA
jgi:hypothetical protein